MDINERKKQVQDSIDSIGSRTNFDNLRKIKHILNGVFGEECNQIVSPSSVEQFEEVVRRSDVLVARVYIAHDDGTFALVVEACVLYEVLVHFPSITITNTRGEFTEIRDLYASFHIRPDGRLKQSIIYGARTTYSNQHYLSCYIHSHLRHRSPTHLTHPFAKFCLGVGPIKQAMTLLMSEFDEINFNLFCLQLRNYVSWESLEGAPHFPMKRIGTSSDILKSIPYDLLDYIVDITTIQIINKEGWTRENLKFEFNRKEVKVTISDQGERDLAQLVVENSALLADVTRRSYGYEKYSSNYILSVSICIKDHHNNYFSLPENEIDDLSISPTPILKFKGEDKFLKITGVDKNIKTIKYGHPEITSRLCKLFSEKFTKEVIASEGVTF